ncbi:hypothetical protein UFOVP28_43 [uncultured Caudovirales phage]|uniref:Uncharacterized protein n=1 Tax=uncultured Caudovirales phage TaxID=2100421 RepID=A0A6J5KNG1_9CAUD|nr:hypothetical protein UFOVP28_43 [uncultured Caudovirales phage]
MSVINFPGIQREDFGDEASSEEDGVARVIESFTASQDRFEEVLIVGIGKDGAISWGSSSDDLRSALWTAKAVERIIMDASLGIGPEDY